MQRAAEAQQPAEHDVAAHHVMPGQPVHLNHRSRRSLGDDLRRDLLSGSEHAVRHDHRLRHACRAGGEHVFGRKLARQGVVDGIGVFGRARTECTLERDRAVEDVVDGDHLLRRQPHLNTMPGSVSATVLRSRFSSPSAVA